MENFATLGELYPHEFEQLEENYWNSCAEKAYQVKEIEEQLVGIISLKEEAEREVDKMLNDSGEPVSSEDRERLIEELVYERVRELEEKKAELMNLDVALELSHIEQEENKEQRKWQLMGGILTEDSWVGAFARLKVLMGEADVERLLKFAAVVPRDYTPSFQRKEFKGKWMGRFFKVSPGSSNETAAALKSINRHIKKCYRRLLKRFKEVRRDIFSLKRGAESWDNFKARKERLWQEYKAWKSSCLEDLQQKRKTMMEIVRCRQRPEVAEPERLKLYKNCGEKTGYRFVKLGSNWYLVPGGPWQREPSLLALERKAYLDLQKVWKWADSVPMGVPDSLKKIDLNRYSIHWKPNGLRVLGQERIWPQIKVRRQMQIV